VNDRERRDRFLLDQMLTHLDVVALNVRKGRDAFETDRTLQYAVEHAIELFAEAAEKLGRGFKAVNPEIPWTQLRELRRVVAHPYDTGADPTRVAQTWQFARDDAPSMARRLRRATFSDEHGA
jgi:uncharacterized protein with HEPN domain